MAMDYDRLHEIENLELLERLLKEGYDPNAYDSFGLTPLHYCENESVANFLISKGADVSKKSLSGDTPSDTCSNWKVKELYLKVSSLESLCESSSSQHMSNSPQPLESSD